MKTSGHYIPNQSKRIFNLEKKYSDIDWTNWNEVVTEFRDRILGWYIRPAQRLKEEPDAGFPIVAICCMLIDSLSQWQAGELEAEKELFMEFVREHITGGRERLPKGILNYRPDKKTGTSKMEPREPLADCAAVLYYGFRCGVLHEAHAKPYCMVEHRDGEKVFYVEKKGLTSYNGGEDCVSVVIDPFALLGEVTRAFEDYIKGLAAPSAADNATLRKHFKKKFVWAFGIAV